MKDVAVNSRGRKAELADEVVDFTKSESQTAALNLLVGRLRGRNEGVSVLQKVVAVAELEAIADIKHRKAYRALIELPDGTTERIATWDAFCERVVGKSRVTVETELKNFEAFGKQALDAMQAMGLSSRKLTAIRATTSEDDLKRLRIAAASAERGALSAELDAIIARQQAHHVEQLAEAEARTQEATRTIRAKERVLELKGRKIDELEQELVSLREPAPSDAEGQLRVLQTCTIDAQLVIDRLVECVSQVMNDPASDAIDKSARDTIDFLAQLFMVRARERGIALNLTDPLTLAHMKPIAELAGKLNGSAATTQK